MNKLLVFPISFMFILTLYAVVNTGITYEDSTPGWNSSTGVIEQQGTEPGNASIEIPSAEPQEINIWSDAGAAVAILLIALSVGVIAGIKVLGSGISELSQKMIFTSILFMGLWACLTVVTGDFFFEVGVLTLLWVALTVLYVIGIGQQITAGASE